MAILAMIAPWKLDDTETGNEIEVSVSERYSMLRINKRTYYFSREDGDFDGSSDEHHRGPILVTSEDRDG